MLLDTQHKDDRLVHVHPLAYLRRLRGWSQQRLADLLKEEARKKRINLATSRNRIWRWECCGTTPDATTQIVLAELLGIHPERVKSGEWPWWLPACDDVRLGFPWSRQGCLAALEEASAKGRADTRGFACVRDASLSTLAQEWRLAEPRRRERAIRKGRADQRLVASLQERLRHLRFMDDCLGGGGLLVLVDDELRLVRRLLDTGGQPAGGTGRLFRVASELAQLAGWVAFDCERHVAAQRYFVAALHAAHHAGDRPLGRHVLAAMSCQLRHIRASQESLQLAWTAYEGSVRDSPPGVRALLAARLSQAYAECGDARGFARTWREAERAFAQHDDPTPHWLYWLRPFQLEAMKGAALLTLGEVARAESALAHAVEVSSPSFVRDRALLLARLAEARLRLGQIERARETIRQSHDLVSRTGSRRVRTRVLHVLRVLDTAPTVDENDPRHAYPRRRSAPALRQAA